MKQVYGVKFKVGGKVYYFETEETYELEDIVVVETSRGMELGEIAKYANDFDVDLMKTVMKPILRKASKQDIKNHKRNVELSKKTLIETQEIVDQLNLDMRMVQCDYTLDGSKVILMYVADERVDFRDLLKALASKYKRRIELKQIGARDKAKMVGGLGVCGLPLCCSTFMSEFGVVSINMAKNQALALNIPKLSGACGKLMCCLKHENEGYKEMRKGLPKPNQKITYNGTKYKVTGINVLLRQIKIEADGDIQFVDADELMTSGESEIGS